MTGELIPKGLRDLVDCAPLDKFIREQSSELVNVSNAIGTFANQHAMAFLIKGDIEGYRKFLERFHALKIPDYRPGLMDMFGMMETRPTMSIPNYLSQFYKDRFRTQDTLTEYLTKSLRHIRREYQTKNGRCDLLIKEGGPFLIELKTGPITRKDIHQCWDYIDGTNGRYPIVLIGHSINGELAKFAEKSGVSVYIYRIKTFAPITVSLTKSVGDSFDVLDRVGDVEYFPEYWDKIARHQGWTPKGERV